MIGGGSRAQAFAQQSLARRIGRRRRANPRHRSSAFACRIQQLLQAILRMAGIECLPAFLVQPAIQPRQHQRAVGQPRDFGEQARRGGDRAGRTRGDHHALGRARLQPFRQQVQRAVLPRRRIDRVFRRQQCGPLVADQGQGNARYSPNAPPAPAAPGRPAAKDPRPGVRHRPSPWPGCRPAPRHGRKLTSSPRVLSHCRISVASSSWRRIGVDRLRQFQPVMHQVEQIVVIAVAQRRGIAATVPRRPAPGRRPRRNCAPRGGWADRW